PGGALLLDPESREVELPFSLRLGQSRAQTRDNGRDIRGAPLHLRHPQVAVEASEETERGRGDTDNDVRLAIDQHRRTEDARVPIECPLPETVGEQRDAAVPI